MIGFGLTSDWMKKWCKSFLSQLGSVDNKNQLRLGTQVKTTLK